MKELMIHVERIVRPVIATQGRKLRMRMELLAHLQAALMRNAIAPQATSGQLSSMPNFALVSPSS